MKDDSNPSPALLRVSQTVSEIVWRYVTTHTAEECEALLRRAEEQRLIRQRAFRPEPVTTQNAKQ